MKLLSVLALSVTFLSRLKLTLIASSCFAITSALSFRSMAILQQSEVGYSEPRSNLLLWAPGLSSCHRLLAFLVSNLATSSSDQALPPRPLLRSISPVLLHLLAQLTLRGDGLWGMAGSFKELLPLTYFSSCLPASVQPWWRPSLLVQRILASGRGRSQGR